jgi:uncharacterized membrane protein
MGNRKLLPLVILGGVRKGPMVSIVTRMFIVTTVYVCVIIGIVLGRANGWTLLTSPTVFGIVAMGIIVTGITYLFWRPRYAAL